MLFNSLSYLIFFALTFAVYWVAPAKVRPLLLLIASYVFYMSWIPVYGLLILAMTLCNYLLGVAIDRLRPLAKPLFVFGVVANLSTLCFYKYTNFLLDSVATSMHWLGAALHQSLAWQSPAVNIILPLGISFFAFEFIHYLTDVYRGGRPIYGGIQFGLFAAFFPSQIAGPIKRYQDFVKQLAKPSKFDGALCNEGLCLFLQGLFKKAALADNLAVLANKGFGAVAQIGTFDAWVAVLAFTLQIYFDFSGYTDMGRGSAMMLGYSLPDNFNFPYLARSVQDFWRRWHISLSTWLRDYLYIPLGGSRCSDLKKQRNLLITMLLGGLWHGASWHFVVWGGYQGLGLIANHKYDQWAKTNRKAQSFHRTPAAVAICMLATFFFVLTSWTFFRANSVGDALSVFQTLFTYKPSHVVADALNASTVVVALAVYAAYSLVFCLPNYSPAPLFQRARAALTGLAVPARAVVYCAVVLAAIGFSPMKQSAFIYFQF